MDSRDEDMTTLLIPLHAFMGPIGEFLHIRIAKGRVFHEAF